MFTDLMPAGYRAILADPPWQFKTYNEKGRKKCPDWRPFEGSPSLHYDTMPTKEICALPVADLTAPDACLFLWITWPMLEDGMAVINAWGFKYKTCAFSWMKADVSTVDLFPGPKDADMKTGYWTRANSEVCLLATKGKPKRLHADVRQGIIESSRQHSRKPDCVHPRIERLVAGPYLELFARTRRPGWTSWGNQLDKFSRASCG